MARTFLSFSKDKHVAEDFRLKNDNPNIKSNLFVVNPSGQENITVTNIDIEEYSYFEDEREVLFLPFSGFEIIDIKEGYKYNGDEFSIIYLNYLNKYEKKVIDYIDARSKDRVESFLKDLVKESKNSIFKDVISEKSIKFIDNYRKKKCPMD